MSNLRKTYGATVAVADVSLTVPAGEIFGMTLTRIECKLFLREWAGVFFVFVLSVGLLTIFSLSMTSRQEAWAGRWPGAVHSVALVAVTGACIALAAKFFRWG